MRLFPFCHKGQVTGKRRPAQTDGWTMIDVAFSARGWWWEGHIPNRQRYFLGRLWARRTRQQAATLSSCIKHNTQQGEDSFDDFQNSFWFAILWEVLHRCKIRFSRSSNSTPLRLAMRSHFPPKRQELPAGESHLIQELTLCHGAVLRASFVTLPNWGTQHTLPC